MPHKESTDIAAGNCGESSCQEGFSWRDGQGIAELGVLTAALSKSCGEDCSSKLDLRRKECKKRYGLACL